MMNRLNKSGAVKFRELECNKSSSVNTLSTDNVNQQRKKSDVLRLFANADSRDDFQKENDGITNDNSGQADEKESESQQKTEVQFVNKKSSVSSSSEQNLNEETFLKKVDSKR